MGCQPGTKSEQYSLPNHACGQPKANREEKGEGAQRFGDFQNALCTPALASIGLLWIRNGQNELDKVEPQSARLNAHLSVGRSGEKTL